MARGQPDRQHGYGYIQGVWQWSLRITEEEEMSLSNANLRSSSSNVTQRRAQGLGSLIAGH